MKAVEFVVGWAALVLLVLVMWHGRDRRRSRMVDRVERQQMRVAAERSEQRIHRVPRGGTKADRNGSGVKHGG